MLGPCENPVQPKGMAMNEIEMYLEGLEGEQARTAARELARSLAEGLGVAPRLGREEERKRPGDRDWGLALGVAAFILNIPASLLAATQLRNRFKAQDRAKVVIELSREIIARHPGLRISISTPAATRVEITTLEPAELVDLASKRDEPA